MAAVALTNQPTSRSGLNVDFETPDVADGVTFNNRQRNVMLVVNNGSAGSINVTLDIVKTLDGMTIADRVVAVPAGAVMILGPFPDLYNDEDNLVTATFSAVADVGAAAVVPGTLMV